MNSCPTLDECIQSLELHIGCLQRAGLRFDAVGPRPCSAVQTPTRAARIIALRDATAGCRLCRLCDSRTRVVFGEGTAEARLMVVGSAPDNDSDTQGRPFAGESGQLLTRILAAIGLQRGQVYLTDAVKCLGPDAVEPGQDCVEACRPILQNQIAIIEPRVICALGPVAARALQGPGALNAPTRGEFYRTGSILVMPTHHPELLLRKPELKRETWIDVQKIQRQIESPSAHNPQ